MALAEEGNVTPLTRARSMSCSYTYVGSTLFSPLFRSYLNAPLKELSSAECLALRKCGRHCHVTL